MLLGREVSAWQLAVQKATRSSSEDAAGLASRRATWVVTAAATTGSAPALLQRVQDLIARIDMAEKAVSVPLTQLLQLSRKGDALQAQVQGAMSGVVSRIDEEDRRLLTIESPPIWQFQPRRG